mmetsp:Transcript_21235/g.29548  ORF Transcript_21235/g.29548 Transcript_21235/m.29548 type:complete len:141 (-) Transcript_21235:445-867(-)
MFGSLRSYNKRERNLHVPCNHAEEGKQLGDWSCCQRKLMNKGKLRDDRRLKLEAIGVVWDQSAEQWNAMFGLLRSYDKRERNVNVPLVHLEKGKQLGTWLCCQRRLMKKGNFFMKDNKNWKKSVWYGIAWQNNGIAILDY